MGDAPRNPFASPTPFRLSASDRPEVVLNIEEPSVTRLPAAAAERSYLDVDVLMNHPKVPPSTSSASDSASKEVHVTIEDEGATSDDDEDDDDGSCKPHAGDGSSSSSTEVLRCTSNAFQKAPTLLRKKTNSRLLGPEPQNPPLTAAEAGLSPGRSGPLQSRHLGPAEAADVEDDEDPFLDDDLPAERTKFRPLTILQWACLFIILAALAVVLAVPALRRFSLWGLRLWKWIVLALALICGRLVSGWGIRLAVFSIERNFLLRRRVLYFVYGVRKPVQNCLWLGLVLLAWHFLLDEEETKTKAFDYVSKVLLCLLVATLFGLAKTIIIKFLASSFHVSTYFDRIQEALFNQYVIEILSGPPSIQVQPNGDEFAVSEVQRLQKRMHRLNQKNVSAWSMKRMMKIVRHGTLSTALDEQLVRAGMEDESAMQIRSEREAKVAARQIFNNVAKPSDKYIYLEDLMHFMREDEALKTMALFEGAQENKRVSKKSLKNWMISAFRERMALALTLNDTKTAVNKLHQMANIVVGVIVFVLWLLILDIATSKFFVFLSSQLLLVAFVFGNTLKMLFEAIIYLFVTHPFDVGDRCEIGGVQMIVEEMNILTTVFLRFDNEKIIYPNSVLATLPIGNIYRSPDMGDSINFCVHVSTPVEKLALMKQRIKSFIERKKEHWYPDPTVMIKDVEDMTKLSISIWLRHRMNFQEMGERWNRREQVVQEMIRVLRELEIEYRMLPLDVNLQAMPALTSTRLPSTWKTCN